MSWVNEIVSIVRENEGINNGSIKVATMTSPNSCKIGNLELTKDDLLFADRLLAPTCTKVSETAPGGGGACTDKSTYLTALKAGDMVAVYQISDATFLVLERMVKA